MYDPTVYVITYYEFNHGPSRPDKRQFPLDQRFLQGKGNYIYYLIDEKTPPPLQGKKVIHEKEVDPILYTAGGKHLAEWSFLLAEEKHAFASYPFYMVSSRFYEKNKWIHRNLNQEWDGIFSLLNEYGWGYLPSYDRPLQWVDLDWRKKVEEEVWKYTFFPFTEKAYHLIDQIYDTNIPLDYRYTADLFCNYIGFQSREHLLQYVNFYKPLIAHFFDDNYDLICDLSPYVKKSGHFRNEKSFTFLLELICHLFFFKNDISYGALHYDGIYEINEREKVMNKKQHFQIPPLDRLIRYGKTKWRRIHTEGVIAQLSGLWKQ